MPYIVHPFGVARILIEQAWYYNALAEVLGRRMQRGAAAHLHARLAAVVRQIFVGV